MLDDERGLKENSIITETKSHDSFPALVSLEVVNLTGRFSLFQNNWASIVVQESFVDSLTLWWRKSTHTTDVFIPYLPKVLDSSGGFLGRTTQMKLSSLAFPVTVILLGCCRHEDAEGKFVRRDHQLYFFSRSSMKNFSESEQTCRFLGGFQPSIHSQSDVVFLLEESSKGYLWLGGQFKESSNSFDWTDGSSFDNSVLKWEYGRPGCLKDCSPAICFYCSQYDETYVVLALPHGNIFDELACVFRTTELGFMSNLLRGWDTLFTVDDKLFLMNHFDLSTASNDSKKLKDLEILKELNACRMGVSNVGSKCKSRSDIVLLFLTFIPVYIVTRSWFKAFVLLFFCIFIDCRS